MKALNEIKNLIKQNLILEAIHKLQQHESVKQSTYYSSTLCLFETRWNHWKRESMLGLDPATSEKNRIVYNLLQFIDEVDAKESTLPTHHLKEHIEEQLSFLQTRMQKMESEKEEGLFMKYLEAHYPKEMDSLLFLDYRLHKHQSRILGSKKEMDAGTDNSGTIRKYKKDLISKILQTPGIPQEVSNELEEVVKNELSLLECRSKELHQASYISYLEKRVKVRERQLKLFKFCSYLGGVGLLIYNTWYTYQKDKNEAKDTRFDENGYDEDGVNPDGYQESGEQEIDLETAGLMLDLPMIFNRNERLPLMSSYLTTTLETLDSDFTSDSESDDFDPLIDTGFDTDDLT